MGCVAVTDPSGGSDVVGMKTTAELKGDKYILNGRKCFITNSHTSDFWVVICKTAEGAKGLSALIVDKDAPGAKLGRKENKFGLRGANTGELAFDNCEVPKENLLGQEGGGAENAAMKNHLFSSCRERDRCPPCSKPVYLHDRHPRRMNPGAPTPYRW